MKNGIKNLKIFLMWVCLIALASLYGEYIVSREVNGYIQLLGFVGMVVLFGYVINETIKFLTINKKEKND
jgi:hypothetical protein